MRCYTQQIIPHIRAAAGGYELITGYDAGFVADLKATIPASYRKYDPERKSWIISAQYGGAAVDLIQRHFGHGLDIDLPLLVPTEQEVTGILKVLYIGTCKLREDGESSAFGWSESGSWDIVFPEQVLKKWFDDSSDIPAGSYYTILGIKKDSTVDEINSGFRRMAKQWHPDVNHEYNATEVFIKIKEAYDVLRNPKLRSRYDAGLALEATLKNNNRITSFNNKYGYRSPLLNGLILASYEEVIGRKIIKNILRWTDITNDFGQTLVSSWVMGEKSPRLEWV